MDWYWNGDDKFEPWLKSGRPCHQTTNAAALNSKNEHFQFPTITPLPCLPVPVSYLCGTEMLLCKAKGRQASRSDCSPVAADAVGGVAFTGGCPGQPSLRPIFRGRRRRRFSIPPLPPPPPPLGLHRWREVNVLDSAQVVLQHLRYVTHVFPNLNSRDQKERYNKTHDPHNVVKNAQVPGVGVGMSLQTTGMSVDGGLTVAEEVDRHLSLSLLEKEHQVPTKVL